MVSDPSVARRFAAANARLSTISVTGTNGKTTTTSMVEAIVRASGQLGARLTTLGAWVGDERVKAESPTTEFLECVETCVERGAPILALEVTSKALAAGFARRWRSQVAVFTNLSRDHLDMHGSADHYMASKAQLFIALAPDGVAILNADDENTPLLEEVISPAVSIRRFSVRPAPALPAALRATRVVATADGLEIELAPSRLADTLENRLELAVVGAVHAQNALAAALAADAAGLGADAIRAGLRAFRGVPGRFEIVARSPLVAVDYAHTPDGLEGTLATARELVGDGGRLVCVFGCGGDRDKGKRPAMGRAVDRLADLAVLTTDNPRFEDPQAIADDVLRGWETGATWHVELDRPSAIEWAIASARPADVIVIAGKGHETVQEVRGESHQMSDARLARAASLERSSNR